MDGVLSDEVTEPVDVTYLQNKENDFLMNPGSSSILLSEEMVTPGLDDFTDSSKNVYLDILDGKNLDRIGSSEHASASPHCDAGTTMVEELTLRNYDGRNLTIGSEKTHTRRAQWQHLYHIGSGSSTGNMAGQIGNKGKGQAIASALEEKGNNFFSGLLDQNESQPVHNPNALMGNLLNNEGKSTPGEILYSCGGIRTKIVNKSGFSEYFIKSNLKGKGVIHKIPGCRGSSVVEAGNQDRPKSNFAGLRVNDAPSGLTSENASHLSHVVSEPVFSLSPDSTGEGISLREWLEEGKNKAESLRIFKQVLDIVNFSHSRGVALQDLRPSMFKLSGTCQITYVGTSVRAGLLEKITDQNIHQSSLVQNKRQMNQSMRQLESQSVKKRKLAQMSSIRRTPQFPSRSGTISISNSAAQVNDDNPLYSLDDVDDENNLKMEHVNKRKFTGDNEQPVQASLSCTLEEKWYTSPEQCNEMRCTFASNIYCLGVLLFELIGSFDSGRSHVATMEDLRYRILPPSFLSENSKEAGFCLWLLHPQPSLRPATREILHSEFVSGIQEISDSEILPSINEEDEESELLSYFLLSLNERKQKVASNLQEQIQRIEADIQEVEKRRPKQSVTRSSLPKDSSTEDGNISSLGANASLDGISKMSHGNSEEKRLVNNMRQLESAYFSMRSNIQLSGHESASHRDRDLLKYRDKDAIIGKEADKYITTDHLGAFFDGLSKYARYSKFKERGVVRNGEFNNSANVMCLSFDRDENYLAAGGVSKKIKVFEFQSLFNDSVDIHYPVVEMANKSRLSCVCWNRYIRNYLASTDYDGIVKLWDASTGQGLSDFMEHSQRAWSVDFSVVDPMKLASGSDDRLVKVWSMNEKNSLCTIKSNANVCSVQFSAESSHLLAFSSADYKTYCYDLRNVSTPWCTLAGHEKAVSYVKFLDARTIVSASTDNTLKIWDLSKTSSHSLSRDACILTLRGHANEKNFVGLSVADGYIACGSETNEVYTYYKSLPMPITSHKFGSIDPITGKETEDNNQQFVSSVCWRRKSNMVVAANSSGCIKLLQLV